VTGDKLSFDVVEESDGDLSARRPFLCLAPSF
jgi:hypothetical protein